MSYQPLTRRVCLQDGPQTQIPSSALDPTVVLVEPYSPKFAPQICSWVPTQQDLSMISSDVGPGLNARLLDDWIKDSLGGFVLKFKERPIAFAVASCNESRLPPGVCEICHLVVAPEHRRRYHGSFVLNWLARVIVGSGYRAVVARVCVQNDPALQLMTYVRWLEVTGKMEWAARPFHWFQSPARSW